MRLSRRHAMVTLEANPPGLRALSLSEMRARPEVVCEWMEGLSVPELKMACTWAAARKATSTAASTRRGGWLQRRSRRERVSRAVERLDLPMVAQAPRGLGGRQLASVLSEAGVRPDDEGSRGLKNLAQGAVRAGFRAHRLLPLAVGDHTATDFVALTQAVDFAVAYGEEAFAHLCSLAEGSDLPFADLAHAVLSARATGLPWSEMSALELVTRFPRPRDPFQAWRTGLGVLFVAVVLSVLALVILGLVSVLPSSFPF